MTSKSLRITSTWLSLSPRVQPPSGKVSDTLTVFMASYLYVHFCLLRQKLRQSWGFGEWKVLHNTVSGKASLKTRTPCCKLMVWCKHSSCSLHVTPIRNPIVWETISCPRSPDSTGICLLQSQTMTITIESGVEVSSGLSLYKSDGP